MKIQMRIQSKIHKIFRLGCDTASGKNHEHLGLRLGLVRSFLFPAVGDLKWAFLSCLLS